MTTNIGGKRMVQIEIEFFRNIFNFFRSEYSITILIPFFLESEMPYNFKKRWKSWKILNARVCFSFFLLEIFWNFQKVLEFIVFYNLKYNK